VIPDDPLAERLRAQVDAILDAAHVPTVDRDDVGEELYAHLIEAWASGVRAGLSSDEAAARAIGDFGEPQRLGRQLTEVFHSRLWASTVGVLIPARPESAARPGIVQVINGMLLAVISLVALISAAWALTQPPVHALVAAACAVLTITGVRFARAGLLRQQSWGVGAAMVALGAMVVEGITTWVGSGGHTFSVSGMAAGLVLLGALVRWEDLRAWATGSFKGPPRPQVLCVCALVLSSWVIAPITLGLPDPTQPSPNDLHLQVTLRCGGGSWEGADVQRVDVAVDWEWERTGVLPGGIANLPVVGPSYVDGLYLAAIEEPLVGNEWVLVENQIPFDTDTGDDAGWQGGGSPADGAIPSDWRHGMIDYGIDWFTPRAHHHYRASWTFISQPARVSPTSWPTATVRYQHVDQWGVQASVACGQTATGVAQ
jgi:hypothetical protein